MPYPLDDNGNIRVDFVWGNFPLQPDEQRTDTNAPWVDEDNQPGDRGWSARSYGAGSDTLNTTYEQGLSVGDQSNEGTEWQDIDLRFVDVPSTHDIITTGYSNFPAFIPNYAGDGDTGLEVVVPNLANIPFAQWGSIIEGAGFVYSANGLTTLGATLGNDNQLKTQTPAAGTKANLGSNVTTTRYTAPTVPNVVGLTESAADTALIGVSLVKGAVTTANNAAGATAENDGLIKTQSVAAGTKVNSTTAVALVKYAYVVETVSAPDVVGLTEAAATTSLTTAGLVKGTVTTANNAAGATSENNGLIKTQAPTAGTTVDIGSSVALVKYAYTAATGPIAGFNRNAAVFNVNGTEAIMYVVGRTVYPAIGSQIVVTGNGNASFNTGFNVLDVKDDDSYNTGGTAIKVILQVGLFSGDLATATGGTWTLA